MPAVSAGRCRLSARSLSSRRLSLTANLGSAGEHAASEALCHLRTERNARTNLSYGCTRSRPNLRARVFAGSVCAGVLDSVEELVTWNGDNELGNLETRGKSNKCTRNEKHLWASFRELELLVRAPNSERSKSRIIKNYRAAEIDLNCCRSMRQHSDPKIFKE